MKKAWALMLCALMMVSMFAGCGGGGEAQSEDVIRIGVYEPASGDNGAGGKMETLGIQYANSLANTVEVGGKEYKIELAIVDNESSTEKAPTAAATLVDKGVVAALGSYGSSVCIAGSDVFANAGIPVVAGTATNPQVTEGNTHYFRICFLDPFQGTVLANFAKDELKAKTAYCLAKLGDDYTVGLCTYFKQAFEALGGTVVYETFPDGNSDFNSYLTNAANAGADVFFSPTSTEAAALIIEQAAAQGMKTPILAGDTWDSSVILNAAKGKDIDVYITTFFDEGTDSELGAEFVKGFKEWVNADATRLANNNGSDTIGAVSAMSYDTYFVVLEAIKRADSVDPVKINEALWDTDYNGVSGHVVFNEIGDADRDAAFVKCVNNETGAWEFMAIQGVN